MNHEFIPSNPRPNDFLYHVGISSSLNEEVVAIGRHFLRKRMCLVLGHDWRSDGAMHAIVEASKEDNSELRLVNVLASDLNTRRHELERYLDPGCRICIGGKTSGWEGEKSGIEEEADLALAYGNPMYLMAGFGGMTKMLLSQGYWMKAYKFHDNGLSLQEKKELATTSVMQDALAIIDKGIEWHKNEEVKRLKRIFRGIE